MSSNSCFPTAQLVEAATFINGDRSTNYPGPDDYVQGEIPFVSASDLSNESIQSDTVKRITPAAFARLRSGKYLPDDVLYCLRGSIGKLAMVRQGQTGAIASSLVIVRAKAGVDPRFLFSFLRSTQGQQAALGLNNGSAQPNVSVQQLQQIRLPLPPRDVQSAVADVLSALDDRITLLHETNATHEAIAQALFKSWFVDFDPVRAKSQGLAPAGMDEATAALFPEGFEESAMGPLPRGWQAVPMADAFEINPSRSLRRGAEATYLEMAGVPISGHCADSIAVRPFGSGTKFRNGDTLLARITPCLENGKTAFVDFLDGDEIGWGSTEFIVLRPKAPLPEYMAYLLCRHAPFREFAERSMSGTSGRQRVQNDVLATYRIAVPPAAVAAAFGELVNPLQQVISGNHAKAATLGALRDTLLPRLISGQLRLPQAEEAIAEATHAD